MGIHGRSTYTNRVQPGCNAGNVSKKFDIVSQLEVISIS
jgi:hypothetical protein